MFAREIGRGESRQRHQRLLPGGAKAGSGGFDILQNHAAQCLLRDLG